MDLDYKNFTERMGSFDMEIDLPDDLELLPKVVDTEYLVHYGILGMKWGVRRYQNKDGSLTPAGLKKAQKADDKWVKKNSSKITEKATKKTTKELTSYTEKLIRQPGAFTKAGKLSSSTINAYNKKSVELMNAQVKGLTTPSGKIVSFVAKRGETGFFMALADQGYNMDQIKNGIFDSGKIAYRKTVVNKINN